MSELVPATKTIAMLSEPSDWNPWMRSIRQYARSMNVWNWCDPDGTDTLNANVPQPPQQYKVAHPYWYTEWRDQKLDAERLLEKVQKVATRIGDTIAVSYLNTIPDEADTPRAMLRALRTAVGYNDELVETQLEAEHKRLMKGPSRTKISAWVNDWITLLGKASSLTDSQFTEWRLVRDFINASAKSCPSFYHNKLNERVQPNAKNTMKLRDLCTTFLTMFAAQQHSGIGAFAATLQGLPEGGNQDSQQPSSQQSQQPQSKQHSRGKGKTTPLCLCTDRHWFLDCPYIDPANRSANWNSDPEIAQRVTNDLRNKEDLRKAVIRAFERKNKPVPDLVRNINNRPADVSMPPTTMLSIARFTGSVATNQKTAAAGDASALPFIKHSFILDSGANTHVCHDIQRFESIDPAPVGDVIACGDSVLPITGYGVVPITIETPAGASTIRLKDVAYIPGFHLNLCSLHRCEQATVWWHSKTRWLMTKDNQKFARTRSIGSFYLIEVNPLDQLEHFIDDPLQLYDHKGAYASTARSYKPHVSISTMDVWHRRMGHAGKEALKHLAENVKGVQMTSSHLEDRDGGTLCTECQLARAPQRISRTPMWRGDMPFQKLHLDLVEEHQAYNGDRYFLHLYDAHTHFHFIHTIPHRSAALLVACIRKTLNQIRSWGYTTTHIHLDPEIALQDKWGSPFRDLTAEYGLIIDRAPVGTKEPNGNAERSGGVISHRARAIRIESGMPENLWPEYHRHAIELLNRTPVQSLKWKTPYELAFRRKPDLSALRIVGSKAYVRIDYGLKHNDRKSKNQSLIGFYLSFTASNIFRIWIPSLNRVSDVRDCIVDEGIKYHPRLLSPPEDPLSHTSTQLLEVETRSLQPYDIREAPPGAAVQTQQPTEDINAASASDIPEQVMSKSARAPRARPTAQPGPSRLLITPEITPEPPQTERIEAFQQSEVNTASSSSTSAPPISTPNDSSDVPDDHSDTIGVGSSQTAETEETSRQQTLNSSSSSSRATRGQTSQPPHRLPQRRLTEEQVLVRARARTREERYRDRDRRDGLDSSTEAESSSRGEQRRQAHLALANGVEALIPLLHAFSSVSSPLRSTRHHRSTLPPPPQTWKDLHNHPLQELLVEAARSEYKQLVDRGTFERIPAPQHEQVLPLKWVFTYKCDPDGYLIKCKARICVRGDLQAPSTEDLYAATGAYRTFRFLMALAAIFDLDIEQMDAITAFINALLDEVVYVQCPEGFEQPGMAFLLRRALYGLKKSPKLWFKELSTTLIELGFRPCPDEPCLFIHHTDLVIIFVYVDDFLLLAPKHLRSRLEEVKALLQQKYAFRDLGPAEHFLNVRIVRDRKQKKVWLCQDAYMDKLVSRFHLDAGISPRITTPLSTAFTDTPFEGEASAEQRIGFQQRVGSIIYPSIVARPDLALAATKLSRFNQNPSPEHIREADRAILYGYNTRYHALEYSGSSADTSASSEEFTWTRFLAASDASFADNREDRKSTQGFFISLFGGGLTWQATKQKTVTTSTTEAELLALSHASKEVISLMRLFKQIGFDIGEIPEILCDNQQTVGIVNKENPQHTSKLRHVDIHQFWLRQEAARGTISVRWVPTADMPADGFTKPLGPQQHRHFLAQLRLVNIEHLIKDMETNQTA